MKPTFSKLPLIIGVAGGTSCGKTEIVRTIIDKLNMNTNTNKKSDRQSRIVHLQMHSFYKELNEEQKKLAADGKYNFDHPDATDFEKCAKTLENMMEGNTVEIAKYDMTTSSIVGHDTIEPADVVIIEGILLLYDEKVRNCLSAKLFVENSAEVRLNARLQKYVKEYNRSPISAIEQYTEYVKPAFEEFCRPTKKYADVIIPRGANNSVAIAMIAVNLQEMFRKLVVSSMSNGESSILAENSENIENQEQRPRNGSFRRPASRPH